MSEPHCEAGTISLRVIGGLGTPGAVARLFRSSSNLAQMRVKAFSMAALVPITVTIRSGQAPSVMLILAPLCNHNKVIYQPTPGQVPTSSLNLLTMSPFLPIILPTSCKYKQSNLLNPFKRYTMTVIFTLKGSTDKIQSVRNWK